MISVLIPIYNYNVLGLVKKIQGQLELESIDFEIICADDNSTIQFEENLKLKLIPRVEFIQLKKNIGRSRIRNFLVEKSRYNWMLFLDADVIPVCENFISNYLKCIKLNKISVYSGGIVYENEEPISTKLLRWTYGRKREQIEQNVRVLKPYQYFLGANFLINKKVFNKVKFNENVIKYGYEDVLFVEELKKNNIIVAPVNNLVFHLGIEESAVYIEKTKQALENLYSLYEQQLLTSKSIKILKTYKIIQAIKLTWLFSLVFINCHKLLEKNLKGNRPNLVLFDIYKLSYFCFKVKR